MSKKVKCAGYCCDVEISIGDSCIIDPNGARIYCCADCFAEVAETELGGIMTESEFDELAEDYDDE